MRAMLAVVTLGVLYLTLSYLFVGALLYAIIKLM